MPPTNSSSLHHGGWSRREILQAGTLGLMGLSMADVEQLQAASNSPRRPRSVIYVFLTGGLAQHESFDPKPDARREIGEAMVGHVRASGDGPSRPDPAGEGP